MQITQQRNNQSFGNLKIAKNAEILIKNGIKNSEQAKEFVELTALLEKNNKIDANIMDSNNKLLARLFANNTNAAVKCREVKESTINKLFGSPVSFLKKVVKSAQNMTEQITKQEEINRTLKNN